jgi:hypothetical protein
MSRRDNTALPQALFTEPDLEVALPKAEPLPQRRGAIPQRNRVPVWTALKKTGVRLLKDTDTRLTAACHETQMGLQETMEAAINAYCTKMKIPKTMKDDSDLKVPRDPDFVPGVPLGQDTRQIVVRLQANTRARFVAGCKKEKLGGQGFANDALNFYFDALGIPAAADLGQADAEK